MTKNFLFGILVFLCIPLVACDKNSGLSSPTSPSFTPDSAIPDALSQERLSNPDSSTQSIQQNCGNPDDQLADDTLLNQCLDMGGRIELKPGNPGYIINGLNGD